MQYIDTVEDCLTFSDGNRRGSLGPPTGWKDGVSACLAVVDWGGRIETKNFVEEVGKVAARSER
jgi:hypothetical protein